MTFERPEGSGEGRPCPNSKLAPRASKQLIGARLRQTFSSPEAKKQKTEPGPFGIRKTVLLVLDDPELAWPIIEEILHIDSSDRMLAIVAAGPVEDLLAHHGAAFIERIEKLAGREPIFRKMLGGVWRSKISEDVWKRLKAVAGPDF